MGCNDKLFLQAKYAVALLISVAVFTPTMSLAAAPTIDSSMADLWAGQASFKPIVTLPASAFAGGNQVAFSYGMNMGTQIVPMNGVWYEFNREFDFIPNTASSNCPSSSPPARVVVRSSTNHGQTWSAETVIATPNAALGECEILDGKAFFDAETNTWHYLAQVLNTATSWGINHYSLTGANPLRPFKPDTPGNRPVITSGSLWSKICGVGKACPLTTNSEGTPEIAFKKHDPISGIGYYYVTFHGANGNIAYRGMAKTADFHTWITSASDLPNNAIWSPSDCQSWNVAWLDGGCVGGGNASTLMGSQYAYMLIESPDVSIGCTAGQNWPISIVRAQKLVATGGWEQIPNAPLMNSRNQSECNLAYQTLFEDGGIVYMSYWTFVSAADYDTRSSQFHIAQLTYNQPGQQDFKTFSFTAGSGLSMGNYHLSYQTNGNLVFGDQFGFPLWSSGTPNQACATGCIARFQSDGNLVLLKNSIPYWSSGVAGSSSVLGYRGPGTTLRLSTSEPYVRVLDSGGDILWSSTARFQSLTLEPNQFVLGNPGKANQFELIMQAAGNLVLYQGGVARWYTGTGARNGAPCVGTCWAAFQTAGNLVLYENTGSKVIAYWATNTALPGVNARWLSLRPMSATTAPGATVEVLNNMSLAIPLNIYDPQ